MPSGTAPYSKDLTSWPSTLGRRSVDTHGMGRTAGTIAYSDQARLQEREDHAGDRGDEYLSGGYYWGGHRATTGYSAAREYLIVRLT